METESPSTPAFDRKMLMDQAGNDPEFLQMILDVFLEEAPNQLEAMRASIEGGDTGLVAQEGHSMKGAAATAAAVTVQKLALGIEMAGKTGDLAEARALFERLEVELERFKSEATQ